MTSLLSSLSLHGENENTKVKDDKPTNRKTAEKTLYYHLQEYNDRGLDNHAFENDQMEQKTFNGDSSENTEHSEVVMVSSETENNRELLQLFKENDFSSTEKKNVSALNIATNNANNNILNKQLHPASNETENMTKLDFDSKRLSETTNEDEGTTVAINNNDAFNNQTEDIKFRMFASNIVTIVPNKLRRPRSDVHFIFKTFKHDSCDWTSTNSQQTTNTYDKDVESATVEPEHDVSSTGSTNVTYSDDISYTLEETSVNLKLQNEINAKETYESDEVLTEEDVTISMTCCSDHRCEHVKKEYSKAVQRPVSENSNVSFQKGFPLVSHVPFKAAPPTKLFRTYSAPSSVKPSRRTCKVAPITDSNVLVTECTETKLKENKISIEDFTSKKYENIDKTLSKKVRSFYKSQNALIENLQGSTEDKLQKIRDIQRQTAFYAKLSFFMNLILLTAKTVAAVLSGSIAIISSLCDSVVDLASGVVIWVTARAVKRTDYLKYPQGKKRLEPLGVIVLSVIMGIASLQLVKESVQKMIGLANGSMFPPTFEWPTIAISMATIVIKLGLYIVCRKGQSPTVKALAQDHRNDVISNSLAILCGYVGSQEIQSYTHLDFLVHVDPIGAIVISLYIAVTWFITGKNNTKVLTGRTAKPEVINKLTWLCLNHHLQISHIDIIKVFHSGYQYQIEACICLPGDMSLEEANDISTKLEKKLENLVEIDRAFIHISPDTRKRKA